MDIKRIDEAVSTIVSELKQIAADPVPVLQLQQKARAYTKGRSRASCSSPRREWTGSACCARCSKNTHPDPSEASLRAAQPSIAEDVQRVAQQGIPDDALRLAVFGPFDDADRFEKLLP